MFYLGKTVDFRGSAREKIGDFVKSSNFLSIFLIFAYFCEISAEFCMNCAFLMKKKQQGKSFSQILDPKGARNSVEDFPLAADVSRVAQAVGSVEKGKGRRNTQVHDDIV